MDTLKGFLKGIYWRYFFFTKGTLVTLFKILAPLVLLTQVSGYIDESWKTGLLSLWVYFAPSIILLTLILRRPKLSVKERLKASDITVEVMIADIFSIHATYVIPINTTFDTLVNNNIISAESLQGKFTNKFYDGNSKILDSDITKALMHNKVVSVRASRVGAKSNNYSIGTVANVTSRNQSAYLLAISRLDEDGIATSSFYDIKEALTSLWGFISTKGKYELLAIPVIGAKFARIKTPRKEIIREIIRSFIGAHTERKFTDKLTVVIYPQDYHAHDLDIYDIGKFLKHECERA